MTNIQSPLDYLEPPDPALTNKIVTHLKSQGIFDQFRRECMADVDTKPAYQNLRQRVEGCVAAFLRKNPWRPDMNKNQMRDNLRKHIQSGGFLDIGVDRIVDQVVNPKIYSVFLPKVEEVVNSCVEMDQGKPKFVPPVKIDPKPQPVNFQNQHNLASRSKLPAPLTGPMRTNLPTIETFKTPLPLPEKNVNLENNENSSNENFMVDEEDAEDTAEDDEESPPFEPNSETERLILGVRTDSSDSNSNDDQVVTSIVDDNLEEIIDNDDVVVNDEDKKDDGDEDSSSDEYVPKTPTINVEGSDGSMIELNTISEYKQYQTKFDEESLGNVVEEIVSSQWVDENNELLKSEKSSTEEESAESSRKRKVNHNSFDEYSNSSVDKGDTSDDGKIATFSCIMKKKIKVEDDVEDEESEATSENVINESYDSNTDRSMDIPDVSLKSEKEQGYVKISNSDSDKCIFNSNNHYDLIPEPNIDKNDEKDESSYYRKKDKHRIKKESNKIKHSEKEIGKHKDKDKRDVKRSDKKDKARQTKHENRDRSRDFDTDKKHDKYNDGAGKKPHESSHSHDKEKRHSSKSSRHSHSSKKHSSSSEKNKTLKDHSHKESTEKHRSHSKSSEKHKHQSRKKSRESCKSRDKEERRRSTDRDSNGPCGRSYMSNTSTLSNRLTSSINNTESSEVGDRTSSNSDNTVSDDIEVLNDDSTTVVNSTQQSISSPKFETSYESESVSNQSSLEWNDSTGNDSEHSINPSSPQSFKEVQNIVLGSNNTVDIKESNDGVQRKDHLVVTKSEFLYGNVNFEKDGDPSSSPEKENRKKDENTVHSEPVSNNIGKGIKFKKPKIAANIFEVRKIMKKRRHMERKRLKFLMDNSSEECLSSRILENEAESTKVDIVYDFDGFEEASSNKIAQYDCLIKKLSEDLKNSDERNNTSEIFSTSWMDIDPSLDDYLKNVLNAKVYRKARVVLPPISEEHYEYNNEENVYVLLKLNSDPTKQNILDSNLNNFDTVLESHDIKSITLNNDEESRSSCEDQINYIDNCENSLGSPNESEIIKLNNNRDIVNLQSLQGIEDCKQTKKLLEDQYNLDKEKYLILNGPLNNESNKAIDVAAPKPVFSITFNQTYDEILKERLQRTLIDAESNDKCGETPRTVVKITNNQKSEQVVVKTVNSNLLNEAKVEAPRITRSVPAVNNEISKSVIPKKQIPFISRVNKRKNDNSSSLKSQQLNGNVSPDSTTNLEMAFFNVSLHHWGRGLRTSYSKVCQPKYANSMHTAKMEDIKSTKSINDIIGIEHSFGSPGEFDSSSQSGDDVSERNFRRSSTRQQRYDSSDLYKPRPQLSTRRGRGRPSGAKSPVTTFIGQKRPAVTSETNMPSKRKR